MSLDKIVAGDYGQVIELTFIDVDTEEAADISAYDASIQMVFRTPDGSEEEKAAAFKNDGTDGVIQYTVENGLLANAGWWRVRGKVSSGSAVLRTEWHRFQILG